MVGGIATNVSGYILGMVIIRAIARLVGNIILALTDIA
jgi:hypothetical protein